MSPSALCPIYPSLCYICNKANSLHVWRVCTMMIHDPTMVLVIETKKRYTHWSGCTILVFVFMLLLAHKINHGFLITANYSLGCAISDDCQCEKRIMDWDKVRAAANKHCHWIKGDVHFLSSHLNFRTSSHSTLEPAPPLTILNHFQRLIYFIWLWTPPEFYRRFYLTGLLKYLFEFWFALYCCFYLL